MRTLAFFIAIIAAPLLSADSSHVINVSGSADQVHCIQLDIDHGSPGRSVMITLQASFTADGGAQHELALFDHGALFADPLAFSSGDYIRETSRSDAGALEISYLTPALSGNQSYTLQLNSDAASWSASGSVSVSGADGAIFAQNQIEGVNDVTLGGSFCAIRAADALPIDFRDRQAVLRLRLDLGEQPRRLSFFASTRSANITGIELWHAPGISSPRPQTLSEALVLRGGTLRQPVARALIASGEGEALDEVFHYESLGWFAGELEIELEFAHAGDPDMKLDLILPSGVHVVEAKTEEFYGEHLPPFSLVELRGRTAGSGQCACCSLHACKTSDALFALLAMLTMGAAIFFLRRRGA